eukprot:365587-Chlamydomonas_euryale.AAC.10
MTTTVSEGHKAVMRVARLSGPQSIMHTSPNMTTTVSEVCIGLAVPSERPLHMRAHMPTQLAGPVLLLTC